MHTEQADPTSFVSFRDGNIVLQADNVRFRVHEGILAANSTVFADMLSVPQPDGGRDVDVENSCPVVVLQDSPEDLNYLLKALYDRR